MMTVLRPALVIAMLATITLPARAEDRSVLLNCKATVARAQKDAGSVSDAELTRCRQIIREWALRDARTTVDEEGKPLR
jgi:hypothetical protein